MTKSTALGVAIGSLMIGIFFYAVQANTCALICMFIGAAFGFLWYVKMDADRRRSQHIIEQTTSNLSDRPYFPIPITSAGSTEMFVPPPLN